jgi:hypothetical protein
MPWWYAQRTGVLIDPNGKAIATGYSGRGFGRNNPAMEHKQGEGPIPCATYRIGKPYDSDKVGPYALPLTTTEAIYGRSDFRIHGNNAANDASRGCVIVPLNIRRKIWESGDRVFVVRPG